MELDLPPESEAKLNELAQRTHRGTDELLQEAVDHLVTYNEWFEHKVKASAAAADLGRDCVFDPPPGSRLLLPRIHGVMSWPERLPRV